MRDFMNIECVEGDTFRVYYRDDLFLANNFCIYLDVKLNGTEIKIKNHALYTHIAVYISLVGDEYKVGQVCKTFRLELASKFESLRIQRNLEMSFRH